MKLLRWILAVVLLVGALHLLMTGSGQAAWRERGFGTWARWALGLGEASGALLLLWAPGRRLGAWLLTLALLAAVAVHLLHHEWPGPLLVYLAAVRVVAVGGPQPSEERHDERP